MTKRSVSNIQQWEPIRDPIYDYIEYNEELEEKVMDTLAVQRLRRLHQLPTARYVYPGADHSRFQHSLGVMHLANQFATYLLRGKKKIPKNEKMELIEAVRIAGLLHDIGHGPFSHIFDYVIIKPCKELKEKKITSHEDLSYLMVKKGDIGDVLEEWKLRDLVSDLLCPKRLVPTIKPIHRAIRQTIHHFIYSSDILDFIRRDAYFCGTKEYGSVDSLRLILSSKLAGSEIALEQRAIECLKGFMISRVQMFQNVYLHRTCRAIDHILTCMLQDASSQLNLVPRVASCEKGEFEDYFELDDSSFIFYVKNRCKGNVLNLADMILQRKNPWRSLAKYEYRAAQPDSALTLKISEDKLREQIGNRFSLKIKEIDSSIEFFVDSSSIPTFPDAPNQMIYTHFPLIDRKGKLRRVSMVKIIGDYKTLFLCTFRIYATEKYREKYPEVESIAEETMREIFQQVPSVEESM